MGLEQEFYRGNYTKILAATVDSPTGAMASGDAPFVIGALSFKGRLHEAEATFHLHKQQLDELGLFMCRFFLGVSFCRHSHYSSGRAYLARNLRAGARHRSARIRFYAWQGAGYYRESCCRFREAQRYASLALSAALEANFLYGKVLSADTLAHSQVGPGQIQAAGENFRRALGYAELLGDGGCTQAIAVSLAIHSARHGLDPSHDIQNLQAISDTLTSEDNYSKSRLLLEIGRQYILRGRIAKAKETLDEACRLVYGSQHRLYTIILNMRYAQILHLAGEPLQALNLVRNASNSLDPLIDVRIATEVAGFEQKLLDAAACPSLEPERTVARQRVADRTRFTGSAVSQRILNREAFRSYNNVSLMGDDPLGDLVDLSYSRSESAVRRLIDSGYHLLLLHKLGIGPGSSVLCCDPVPGALIACANGEMHVVTTGVSQVIRTLLRSFAKGAGSKEELIQAIWKYSYNPLKHDQLIYTAVSRLRQLLGPFGHWIEVTEAGYQLAPSVTAQFLGQASAADVVSAQAVQAGAEAEHPEAHADPSQSVDGAATNASQFAAVIPLVAHAAKTHHANSLLNHRQLGIVDELRREAFIDARVCSALYKVSEVSARRDLSQLFALGIVQRHGKGRATKYSLLSSGGGLPS